jgi:hypothetical protein
MKRLALAIMAIMSGCASNQNEPVVVDGSSTVFRIKGSSNGIQQG